MDRRNGGDPQAPPPRPPKSSAITATTIPSIPSVHRPPSRILEPLMMSASNLPQLSPKPNRLSLATTNSAPAPSRSSNINNNIINLPPRTSSGTDSLNNNRSPGVSLRHQLPPPLPPAPVSSRSPVVNRSVKPPVPPVDSSVTSQVIFTARFRPTPPPPVSLITSTVPALSSSLIPSTDPTPSSPVTLAQPRPENERLGNEYVDTPFSRSLAACVSQGVHRHFPHPHQPLSHNGLTTSSTPAAPEIAIVSESKLLPPLGSTATTTIRTSQSRPSTLPAPITKQPASLMSKDSSTSPVADEVDFTHASDTLGSSPVSSIICPQCDKCRCGECQLPRQLPSRWLCNDSCLCSAESAIDYLSCLFCVKAFFYHCSRDHELEHESDTITCADNPCSCGPHRFATRWGCMAALSFLLPCLMCYWPMRGCVAVCTKCYAYHARPGCRCPPNQSGSGATFNSTTSASKTGRSISNILNRNQSTATNNSHNHLHSASTQLHDLAPEKRLLDSSHDY